MKIKLHSIAAVAALIAMGCGGIQAANNRMLGITDDKLKEKVSFDTDCPAAQIEVIKKREDQGSGDYVVNACGKELKYGRTGSVYHAAGQDPVAAMNGEKAAPAPSAGGEQPVAEQTAVPASAPAAATN